MSIGVAETAAAIAEFGETVTLRRRTGTKGAPIDVVTTAVLRGYQPRELVDGIVQGDQFAILSNADIAARQWPGPPQVGDQLITDAGQLTVLAVEVVNVGAAIVRHNLQLRG